ncbi:MAG TPA: plastocyanin/azurin family copper-binding protein [Actinomycetota bacterium]|nr:plastocyanin/azurin family copper-binding protein [Actinomycetota bacterium]
MKPPAAARRALRRRVVAAWLAPVVLFGTVAGVTAWLRRPPPVSQTFRVTMSDYAFAPNAFTVSEGQRVRFVFHNASGQTHEALIGDTAAQAAHDRLMRTHGDSMAGMDLPVVDVAPGRTATLDYTFAHRGTLLIGCHQPGHYAQGMRATVIVQ